MKTIVRVFLLSMLMNFIGCDHENDRIQKPSFSVKIISPKDDSFYYITNSIRFQLNAYDSSGNWTEIDSQKWISDLVGQFGSFDGHIIFGGSLNTPGLHEVTAYAYKANQVASDKISVKITDSLYLISHNANNSWTVYDVPTEYVYTMEHDKLGRIIVGTIGTGIIYGKYNLWTFFSMANSDLISNEIQSISVDNNNSVYIGHGYVNGINKYDGVTWSRILMPDTLWDIHSIAFRNDTLWAGDHVGRILFYTGVWNMISSQPRYFGHPGKIEFDKNGVLWGNSEHSGSFRYDGTNWDLFNPYTNGMPGCSYELTIDKQNHVWFGTCDEGLFWYDGLTWTKTDMSNSQLPSNSITALCSDGNNNIWIGTDKGLAKFDHNVWTIYNAGNSPIPDDLITCLTVDDSNHVWIGTPHAITLFKNK